MSASDFLLSDALEVLVAEVCTEHAVPPREHDAIRALVSSPPGGWPACCGAECRPCVEEQKSIAREVIARHGTPVRLG